MDLTYDLLEDRCRDDLNSNNNLLSFYLVKEIDSMLLWVCTSIDHGNSDQWFSFSAVSVHKLLVNC